MTDYQAVRNMVAAAASTTEVPCLPYEPDTATPPIAWIDSLTVDQDNPAAFGVPNQVTAVIVAVAQRHDRAGSTALLEGHIPGVTAALEQIPGVRVPHIVSGTAEIGKTELPSVAYTIQFAVA